MVGSGRSLFCDYSHIVVSEEVINPAPDTYGNLVSKLQRQALHEFMKRDDDALEAVCPAWKHYRWT